MAEEIVEESETFRRPRRAKGGKAVNKYNAQGSPAMDAAEDETEDFKRGGRSKRKAGGMAEGGASEMRADKMPRGRHAAGGRASHSPYSSGSKISMNVGDEASKGHEGVKVPSEPGPG